ncbi:hypothetical protein BpHYR1_046010 [Brachionus plicatilis]|uniref:Uncharacterized protein n=1 Tax=Brachionus plicatilis TaxID=10195 RepID=A0A3M7Q184_BRAPC|nr:hypothetical protein BpHYR1_046010 [Brachionus plicatilis]
MIQSVRYFFLTTNFTYFNPSLDFIFILGKLKAKNLRKAFLITKYSLITDHILDMTITCPTNWTIVIRVLSIRGLLRNYVSIAHNIMDNIN